MKKKSIVFSSIILGIAVLTFILWFLPSNAIENVSFSTFNLMRLLKIMAEEDASGLTVVIPFILSFILNIIIIAFGIITLLNSCGVIKNAKLAKAFRITDIVLVSLATLIMLFLTFGFAAEGGILVGVLVMVILNLALIVLMAIDLSISVKTSKVVEESVTTVAVDTEEVKAEEVKAEEVNTEENDK